MNRTTKIHNISLMRDHLNEVKCILERGDITDKITPEGKILADIEINVLAAHKRIGHALTVAQSHR